MSGFMNRNWLGVASISEELPPKIHQEVEKKIDELEEQVAEAFDEWLKSRGMERAMGIIIKRKQDNCNV